MIFVCGCFLLIKRNHSYFQRRSDMLRRIRSFKCTASLLFLACFLLTGNFASFVVHSAEYTWTGDVGLGSWHALLRLDPPDPERYINNFGNVGNPPAFPGSGDSVTISSSFSDPFIHDGDPSILSLTLNGSLSIQNGRTLGIASTVNCASPLLQAMDGGTILMHGASFINNGEIGLFYGGMFGAGILHFADNCIFRYWRDYSSFRNFNDLPRSGRHARLRTFDSRR